MPHSIHLVIIILPWWNGDEWGSLFSPQQKYIMPYDYRQFPLYIIFAQEKTYCSPWLKENRSETMAFTTNSRGVQIFQFWDVAIQNLSPFPTFLDALALRTRPCSPSPSAPAFWEVSFSWIFMGWRTNTVFVKETLELGVLVSSCLGKTTGDAQNIAGFSRI